MKNLLLMLGIALASAHVSAESMVVIANPGAGSSLSKDQVANIYLGKKMAVPWGGEAFPVDLPDTSPLREKFYVRLTGKTAAETKAYWARLIFTGMGLPPRQMKTDEDVKKLVSTSKGAIGYIDSNSVDASIKVVYSE